MKRLFLFKFPKWRAHNIGEILLSKDERMVRISSFASLLREEPRRDERILHWGAQAPEELVNYVKSCWSQLFHVEDGFIRSVGLGSDLVRPMSLVIDRRGLYFDARRPSDLEVMLNTVRFKEADLNEASRVRQFIVSHQITKYNHESLQAARWPTLNKRIILVPGQVNDDASILLGCDLIRSNVRLLDAVRTRYPDAYIVYKPHPDVVSGNRRGYINPGEAMQYANHIEQDVSIVKCIEACDEVHTMTSLAGFDALLRGKHVVTYGSPFYAGWGLTEDHNDRSPAFHRRQRILTLDELVAGALLSYPIYWDFKARRASSCMTALRRISEERCQLERSGMLSKLQRGWIRRQLRKLQALIRSAICSVIVFTTLNVFSSVSIAQEKYSLDSWWQDVRATRYETTGVFLGATALGIYSWDWGSSRSFRSNSEGWFGESTSSGGSDKLGHAFTSYATTNVFADRLTRQGIPTERAALSALLTTQALMLYVEVFDGYSNDHGFSREDIFMNLLGSSFAYARNVSPSIRNLLDFRLEYVPSGYRGFRPISDYEGQKYVLALKLSGIEAFRESYLRFLELQVGYFSRGFSKEARAEGIQRERQTFIGVGINFEELLLGRRSRNESELRNGSRFLLEHLQIPGTSARSN